MLNTSIKAMLAVGVLASVAGCKSTIESYIEDEIGDRLNEMAGDRLYLAHGDTTLNGQVRTGSVSTDGGGLVTSTSLGSQQNGSIPIGTNIGEMETLTMTNSNGATRFATADGDEISDGMDALVLTSESANGRNRGWMGNAIALDFDHQTFGMWATGVGTSDGSVSVGSFGSRTASANVPTSGTATYQGTTVGMAVTTDGRALVSESQIGLTTSDFPTSMSQARTPMCVTCLAVVHGVGNIWISSARVQLMAMSSQRTSTESSPSAPRAPAHWTALSMVKTPRKLAVRSR